MHDEQVANRFYKMKCTYTHIRKAFILLQHSTVTPIDASAISLCTLNQMSYTKATPPQGFPVVNTLRSLTACPTCSGVHRQQEFPAWPIISQRSSCLTWIAQDRADDTTSPFRFESETQSQTGPCDMELDLPLDRFDVITLSTFCSVHPVTQ